MSLCLRQHFLRLRVSTFSICTCNYSKKTKKCTVMHIDDRIFGKCSSPLTIGLGHGLDHPVNSLQYSSFIQNKLQKIGNSDYFWPTDWLILLGSYKVQYTSSCITQTHLYQIISYLKGHPPHQKSLH